MDGNSTDGTDHTKQGLGHYGETLAARHLTRAGMVLLERTPALGSVTDYLAAAASGHGRLVFIGGEAGVGKSTLVERVVHDAGSTVRVARGACDGSSTPSPLGPLREMLPALPGGIWPDGVDRAEVFTRLSGLELAGDVSRLRSNFINGIKHMPVRFTPVG